MRKIIVKLIEAITPIFFGVIFALFKQYLAGSILAVIGVSVLGTDKELRKYVLSIANLLLDQVMKKREEPKTSNKVVNHGNIGRQYNVFNTKNNK